jgi:putative restriction endonuclease
MPEDPDVADIRERFRGVDPHKQNGRRSPHRPLLVLYALGRLEAGERRLSYEQIDRDVGALLDAFGPPHHTSAKYPFWYLREDGVWEVEEADKLPRRSGKKEPLVSAMKDCNTHGWFPDDVCTALQEHSALRRDVAQMMLDKCFPRTLHQDILDAVGLASEPEYYPSNQSRRDPAFRKEVLEAYDHRCAVCGFDLSVDDTPFALEAAHIHWHQYDGPDLVSNGLALCVLHHKMLDRGIIHVNTDLRLIVAEDINGSTPHRERLLERHGEDIYTPQRVEYAPDKDYLHWHVNEVFRGEYTTA